jgi:VanZ family protein
MPGVSADIDTPAWLVLIWLLSIALGLSVAELLLGNTPWASAARLPSRVTHDRRSHTAIVVVLAAFAFLAAYGSWVPFRVINLGLGEAFGRFVEILCRPAIMGSRTDWATNVLLFAPIGFLLTGIIRSFTPHTQARVIALPAALLACMLGSAFIEFGQLWIAGRTCSQNDLVAQGVGGLCGGVVWLVTGNLFLHWLDRFLIPAGPDARLAHRLEVYLVLWVGYMLLPLDVTLRPAELFDKYQEGRISLALFHDLYRKSAWEFLGDGLLVVPMGVLAAVWRWCDRASIRPFWKSLLRGAAILASVEVAQIFVFSRHSSVTDLAIGCLGMSLGWAISHWRVGQRQVKRQFPHVRVGSWALIAAPFVCSVSLIATYCLPLDGIASPAQARARLERLLHRPPLAVLYAGTPMNALDQSLRKILHFSLLGGLSAWFIEAGSWKKQLRWLLVVVAWLAGVGLAAGIEWLQIYLPAHVADTSDIVLAALGVALGLTVMDSQARTDETP